MPRADSYKIDHFLSTVTDHFSQLLYSFSATDVQEFTKEINLVDLREAILSDIRKLKVESEERGRDETIKAGRATERKCRAVAKKGSFTAGNKRILCGPMTSVGVFSRFPSLLWSSLSTELIVLARLRQSKRPTVSQETCVILSIFYCPSFVFFGGSQDSKLDG